MDISNLRVFETKNKFCLCFGTHYDNIKTVPESMYTEKGVDVQAFKRLLIKTEFEEYTDLLLANYWLRRESVCPEGSLENSILENFKYIKELTNVLITLLSSNTSQANITFQKSRLIVKSNNTKIINVIIKALTELLIENPLNISELTTDEKAVSLLSTDDVTIEFLVNLDKYLTSQEIDFFTPKNLCLKLEIKYLSYLIRIDRFLNQVEIEEIDNYPLKSADYKIIYDILDFFQMIKPEMKTSTTPPDKYIRSILDQTNLKTWDSLFPTIRQNINDLRNFKYSMGT